MVVEFCPRRPASGRPVRSRQKNFSDASFNQKSSFESKTFFRIKSFLNQIRAAEKQSQKLIAKNFPARNHHFD